VNIGRVLLAVDGSDRALRACAIAVPLLGPKTQVRLLTVLSYDKYPHALGEHRLERQRSVDRAVLAAQRGAAELLAASGADIAHIHRFGKASDEILGEIEEWSPDLVVIGRRGLGAPARWLGSVSEAVLHRSRVPVLVVP
jgi:nucleotide-binding universal stress UspA family protein